MTTRPPLPGEFIGKPVDGEPKDEAGHFIKCPGCGQMVDMRDLAQAFEHDTGSHSLTDKPADDLEARLRREAVIAPAEHWHWLNPLLIAAADEIKRLRDRR